VPRFGLRREEIEELLGLAALRARQAQFSWQLTSSRNPHDVAQAEGALDTINAQIATLEAIAEVIEHNNQQLLNDLQRLLGATRRPAPAASRPPGVTNTSDAGASPLAGSGAPNAADNAAARSDGSD
jgi:hypothetical protein